MQFDESLSIRMPCIFSATLALSISNHTLCQVSFIATFFLSSKSSITYKSQVEGHVPTYTNGRQAIMMALCMCLYEKTSSICISHSMKDVCSLSMAGSSISMERLRNCSHASLLSPLPCLLPAEYIGDRCPLSGVWTSNYSTLIQLSPAYQGPAN